MFVNLVKAMNSSEGAKKKELSEDRLKDLMDKLFSPDEENGARMSKGDDYNDDDMEDSDSDSIDDDDDMEDQQTLGLEKGANDRREMMDRVYSLVDNLSDEELQAIIDSKSMKKAMVMNVFSQMSNQDLADFVSQTSANGEQGMEQVDSALQMEVEKACEGDYSMRKGDDMEEDLDQDDLDLDQED
jgi:hypothetical protein